MAGKIIRYILLLISIFCLGMAAVLFWNQKKAVDWAEENGQEICLTSVNIPEHTSNEFQQMLKEILADGDKEHLEFFLAQQTDSVISDIIGSLTYQEYQKLLLLLPQEFARKVAALIPVWQLGSLEGVLAWVKTGLAELADGSEIPVFIYELNQTAEANISVKNFFSGEIDSGRFFDEEDSKKDVAVIYEVLEERLFGKGKGIGKTIQVSGIPYTIVGVYRFSDEFVSDAFWQEEPEQILLNPNSSYEKAGKNIAGIARIYLHGVGEAEQTAAQFFDMAGYQEEEWIVIDQGKSVNTLNHIFDGFVVSVKICILYGICRCFSGLVGSLIRRTKKRLKTMYLGQYLSEDIVALLTILIGLTVFFFAAAWLMFSILDWTPDWLAAWLPEGRVIDMAHFKEKYQDFTGQMEQWKAVMAGNYLSIYRYLLTHSLKRLPAELILFITGTVCLSGAVKTSCNKKFS